MHVSKSHLIAFIAYLLPISPIQTYGDQGVAKRGVVKSHHAPIYTGRVEPEPSKDELPNLKKNPSERAMLDSIRVQSYRKSDILHKKSRVNFAKIYTVEHNVKVYDFGEVHKKSLHILAHQFNLVWNIGVPAEDESDSESEEEEQEEEEEEEQEEEEEIKKDTTTRKKERSKHGKKRRH
jgi:hypothetical protein